MTNATDKMEVYEHLLPDCCMEYLNSLVLSKQNNTILAYAHDLTIFFEFVTQKIDRFKNRDPHTLTDIEVFSLTERECLMYARFLTSYTKDGVQRKNSRAGAKRKIVSARNLFQFFFKQQRIHSNPMSIVETPSVKGIPFVALEGDEIESFLNNIKYGDPNFSSHQSSLISHERTRDLALFYLLLSTGIRVSECANINISDVDLEKSSVQITRKGGNVVLVFPSDTACEYLRAYMDERLCVADCVDTDAFFLSRLNKRLSVRSIQLLAKKFSQSGIPKSKNVHPHTMRKTFGLSVYNETHDIKKVKECLGHTNIAITDSTYSDAISERERRELRNTISPV